MLQQTQVDTVIPYFHRFTYRFPTIAALSEAVIQDVLKEWEGLGYYSRARNLHRAAGVIVCEHAGHLPKTFDRLRTLPGFGDYTAAAVASIAFGEAIPALDGNALRVFSRYWGIKEPIQQASVKKDIFTRLLPVIKTTQPAAFNQAVMELGALVCRPQSPDCSTCPIHLSCIAKTKNLTKQIPNRLKRRSIPQYQQVAGVIWCHEQVLISRRDYGAMLGGLWEFPGCRVESEKNIRNVLAQKILKQTGLRVRILDQYGAVKHGYSHFKIVLYAFKCHLFSDESACDQIRDDLQWIKYSEMTKYPFDKATLKVIELINRGEPNALGMLVGREKNGHESL